MLETLRLQSLSARVLYYHINLIVFTNFANNFYLSSRNKLAPLNFWLQIPTLMQIGAHFAHLLIQLATKLSLFVICALKMCSVIRKLLKVEGQVNLACKFKQLSK